MARFWRLIQLYRKEIYVIYLYAIFNGLINLSLPIGIQAIVNFIQVGTMSTSWVILVGLVLFGIALTGVIQVLQLRIVENIQQDIFARSSFEFAFRLPRIKLSALELKHAPELVNRFFDTLTIQKGLPKILIDLSLAIFQVVFGLLLLSFYSSYFIVFGIFLVFLVWLIFRFTGPRGLKTSLKESKHKYRLAHLLEEIARVNKSLKLNPNGKLHLKKTDGIVVDYLKAREGHFRILLQQFQYFIGFKIIIAAGLLILGSILVFNGQMNIGQFVASEIIILLIITSIEKLIRIMDTIFDVLTALEKIGFVLDLEMDEGGQITQAVHQFEKGVDVEATNLSFSYPYDQGTLIKNLSFAIKAGDKVQIAGKSGTGKSTLLKLLAGLYHFDDGDVLINGVPIHNYKKEALYSNVGVYLPTNQLFEGTIWENIDMGRNLPKRQIFDVIEKLNLRPFIAKSIKGLDTIIDPEGRKLPRSIIQKLLIARAIVHQPKLLLLEDPIQFVEESEKKGIIDYIMDKNKDWTVFVIADHPYWKEKCVEILAL